MHKRQKIIVQILNDIYCNIFNCMYTKLALQSISPHFYQSETDIDYAIKVFLKQMYEIKTKITKS